LLKIGAILSLRRSEFWFSGDLDHAKGRIGEKPPGALLMSDCLFSPVDNGARVISQVSSHRNPSGILSLSIELLVERLMPKKNQSNSEMLKGTLDMMILRTLIGGDAHGHTIAKVIERTSEDVLEVEQGSLYPALHRLEDRKWVSSYWGASENNRKAKFYRLTAEGRKQLVRETSRWRQMTRAIGLVMGGEGGAQ
jgi:PadR family transcriptional regulator, regulatory protein PadR